MAGENQDYPYAKELFQEMVDKELQPNKVTYNSMIEVLLFSSEVKEAKELFQKHCSFQWKNGALDCHELSRGAAAIQVSVYIDKNEPPVLRVITGKGLHSHRHPLGEMRTFTQGFVKDHHPNYQVEVDEGNEGCLVLRRKKDSE